MNDFDKKLSEHQIAVFHLEGLFYGIDIQDINEIIQMQEVTELPNTAPHIEGVINLRGSICTILNGREMLGLPKKKMDNLDKIIVLDIAPIGIIVDEVSEIISIKKSETKTIEGIEGLESLDYVDYLVEVNSNIITVIDAKKWHGQKNIKGDEEKPRKEHIV